MATSRPLDVASILEHCSVFTHCEHFTMFTLFERSAFSSVAGSRLDTRTACTRPGAFPHTFLPATGLYSVDT